MVVCPAWAAVIKGVSPREFRGSMWLVCGRRAWIAASSPVWAAMERGVSFGAMVIDALEFQGVTGKSTLRVLRFQVAWLQV